MSGSGKRFGVRVMLAAAIGLLLAGGASAQTADSYTVRIYNPGAAQPIQTESFVAASAICNQAAPVPASTVNPTRFVWDDPVNVGRVCIATETTNGVLFSVPVGGNYEGTLAAVNAAGSSTESNRASFSRLGVPTAPAGFRAVK